MRLQECLEQSTKRHLMLIARLRHIKFDTQAPKAAWVTRLTEELLVPKLVRQLVASLSEEELAALKTLIAHHGQISLRDFCKHFGRLRPYRPWRKEQQEAPWPDPSPTERLCYWGLAFPISLDKGNLKRAPNGLNCVGHRRPAS